MKSEEQVQKARETLSSSMMVAISQKGLDEVMQTPQDCMIAGAYDALKWVVGESEAFDEMIEGTSKSLKKINAAVEQVKDAMEKSKKYDQN